MNPEFTEERIAKVLQAEDSESISKWQFDTFGYQIFSERLDRIGQEFDELNAAMYPFGPVDLKDKCQRVADECVDMVILLNGLYEFARELISVHNSEPSESWVPLDAAVDYKMAINRLREWKDGQHV